MGQEHDFSKALDQAILLAEELERLLLAETATLSGRDPEQIQSLADKKRQVVTAIEQQTTQLKTLVEGAGHCFTRDGLDTFLASFTNRHQPNGGCSARWQILKEVTTRCELMNRTNAKTIERHRKRVAAALKLIRGEDDSAGTYSANGRSQPGAFLGRTLTRA